MRVPTDVLQALVADIFGRAGCSTAEADRIAAHLLAADLAGHPSHGVVRVRGYIDLLAAGGVVAGQDVEVVSENETMTVLDGGYGFGQTVGEQAVAVGLEKVAASGVAVVALRHAGHLGRIADWALAAADAGIVSIHFVNVTGAGLVAPFGGRERRFGTNPIAIGIPQLDRPPILIDFATSVVAEGKARVALNGGKPVPDDALVGPDGEATGDTAVLYGEPVEGRGPDPRQGPGALRAMGDQKGSALALACEILAGVLTGSGVSGDMPFCNGMLSIYLSPDHFGAAGFVATATEFADHVRAAAPSADAIGNGPAGDGVKVPGDIERALAGEQRANGIDLADGTWDDLRLTAAKVGAELPSL
ncbi:MAG: Ldh family oxidoreductase [Actinomycetota bacterium]